MAAGSSTDPVRFPTDMLTVPSALAALLVIVIGTAPLPFPAAAQVHQRAPVPGEVDPRVIQATIQSTICTPGHTAKVRPPRKVTDAIKRKPAQELPGSPSDYELDHLIPIGLGGHPHSIQNLWLQAWTEAAAKDREELRLHRAVCSGRMTLDEAQQEALATWGPRP